MLYSEFIKGTGCRDSEENYKIYKDLEVMYMNSDLSKKQIYEYGKKLVDDSKPQSAIDIENDMKEKIAEQKGYIEEHEKEIERYKSMLDGETDDYWIEEWNRMIKVHKNSIREAKSRIKEYRWVLSA